MKTLLICALFLMSCTSSKVYTAEREVKKAETRRKDATTLKTFLTMSAVTYLVVFVVMSKDDKE